MQYFKQVTVECWSNLCNFDHFNYDGSILSKSEFVCSSGFSYTISTYRSNESLFRFIDLIINRPYGVIIFDILGNISGRNYGVFSFWVILLITLGAVPAPDPKPGTPCAKVANGVTAALKSWPEAWANP